MSVTVGKVSEFNPNEDDWNTYIEQLDFFFEGNRISDQSQRKAILLSSCGITTYKLFKGLTASSKHGVIILKPGEKSFDELKQLMLHHHNPRPNMIAERERKCFDVCCRIEEVDRILRIRRIVKRYVEGQISLWY